MVGGIDTCDGDRQLDFEAGGQEHTPVDRPVSRAASPHLFAVIVPDRAPYCDGVRRFRYRSSRRALPIRGDCWWPLSRRQPFLFYLLLAGGGEEPVAAGGASIMARANASIAIFQAPFSRFSILNQFPWMVLSLTVTE